MNDKEQFDKFTEPARKVLSLAQEEAQRFNHNYIGTEHLLLGLVKDGNSTAAKVLRNLGVEPNKVRAAVQFIIGRGDRIVLGSSFDLTPRSKKVIELAVDEARRLNHDYIGTEHLLLGLVREAEGIGARILENLGVNLEKARTQTLEVLGQSGDNDAGTVPHQETGNERFDKFTDRARKVLSLAQEEAQRFNHQYLGTEHLLLGLVKQGDSTAAKVLENLGVHLNKVRSAVEFIINRGDRIVLGDIGLTPRSKKVIELAVDEARRLNHQYIGTEHLLLGLIRERNGIAAGVLGSLGVSLEKARTQTLQILNQGSSGGAEGGTPPPMPGT